MANASCLRLQRSRMSGERPRYMTSHSSIAVRDSVVGQPQSQREECSLLDSILLCVGHDNELPQSTQHVMTVIAATPWEKEHTAALPIGARPQIEQKLLYAVQILHETNVDFKYIVVFVETKRPQFCFRCSRGILLISLKIMV